ncbi:rRNA-processing protein EFG1 [Hondaea fermentalgiana]|uniref:rRNA-processing protein EFG1 n=1 Tax=Hondaea fermentalgiana TaxID=2315210 RepID=A0A2R5GVI8_9STRA|nr:rRNA-processing protein EFG1 [Hondaea fermentalgiana]|eukprot:GBG33788.1 rRNA-processing protein EFG1 [Hondaea fermentalgiana]
MPAQLHVQVRGLVVPNASARQVSTRHDPQRYEALWEEIKEALQEEVTRALANSPLVVEIIREKRPEKVILGSFEIDLVVCGVRYSIFSKVRRGRFPSARCVLKRVRSLLGLDIRQHAPLAPDISLAPARTPALDHKRPSSHTSGGDDDNNVRPLQRMHLIVTDAYSGRPIGMLDDLRGTQGASLACTDAAGYQLSIFAADPADPADGHRGSLANLSSTSSPICYVEVEQGSTLVFSVRHAGWELVSPMSQVYVDTNGPAALCLVAMRIERVQVRLQSISGCALGAGIRVRIEADRRGLRFRGLADSKIVSEPSVSTLVTDASGTVAFDEYWGTVVDVHALDDEDWIFSSVSAASEESHCRLFVGRQDNKAGAQPEAHNEDEEPWVYDSCDEDERDESLTNAVDDALEAWSNYKAGEALDLVIDSARPRQKWATLVSDTVVRAGVCLCKNTQSNGGFIVRVHEASASVKGWCTCRCEAEQRLGLRQTLGYQALARGAPVLVKMHGQWMSARLVKRSPKGILHCRLMDQGPLMSLQTEAEQDGKELSQHDSPRQNSEVAVSVASVRPDHVMLRTDVWRAVSRSLLSFSMLGYSCARKQVTRVHVLGLAAHPDLVKGVRVARFAGKAVGTLTAFSVDEQWIEFQHGLQHDIPHACSLVIGRGDGTAHADAHEDHWMRPQCAPLQVSASVFMNGMALQTFGRAHDGRHGDWTCYVVVAQHVRVLAAKLIKKPPALSAQVSGVVADFRDDAVENMTKQAELEKHVRFKLPAQEILISPVAIARGQAAGFSSSSSNEQDDEGDDFDDAEDYDYEDDDDFEVEAAATQKPSSSTIAAMKSDDAPRKTNKASKKNNKKKKNKKNRKRSAKAGNATGEKRSSKRSASAGRAGDSDSDLTSLDSDEEVAEIAALRKELAQRRAQKKRQAKEKPSHKYDERGTAEEEARRKASERKARQDRPPSRKVAKYGRHKPEKSESDHERERVIARKNHRVKFFERQKVERTLKKVLRKLEDSPEDQALLDEKKKLLTDLRYTRFFPHDTEYISLFNDKLSQEQQDLRTKCRQRACAVARRTPRGTDAELTSFYKPKKNTAQQKLPEMKNNSKNETNATADADEDDASQNKDEADGDQNATETLLGDTVTSKADRGAHEDPSNDVEQDDFFL